MNRDTNATPAALQGRFVVLGRNSILHWVSLALLVVGPLMLFAFTQRVFPPGVMGGHLTILALIAQLWVRRQNVLPFRRERDVRVTEEGVRVDGVLAVRKQDIVSGQFQPRPEGTRRWLLRRTTGSSIRLFGKRKEILFEAEVDEPTALDALRVLELDATKRRAEYRASSPLFATTGRSVAFSWSMVGMGFALSILGKVVFGITGPLGIFVMVPLLLAGMLPTRVSVGIDGVLIRWLWQKRFVPMRQIASVSPVGEREIMIHLTNGETVTIHATMARSRSLFARQQRDAILARIREAHGHFMVSGSGGPTVDVAALVGRGSRGRGEWLAALRRLRDVTNYREAVVRDEDLWAVVEDPAAPEDARAGAAIALRAGKGLDADGKARIRVAAEATASPRLRVALDAASGDSTERATDALNELFDDEVSQARALRSPSQ